jgi:hypothetical protein
MSVPPLKTLSSGIKNLYSQAEPQKDRDIFDASTVGTDPQMLSTSWQDAWA